MLTNNKVQRLWDLYLKEHGKAWLKVQSGSMAPMIPVGAFVLVNSCYFKDLRLFDLAVFKSRGHLVVHRVIQKRKESLLQRGDNFSLPFFIHKECILGRVELIKTPVFIIDLKKRKNFFVNIIISFLFILSHKIPNHNFCILQINRKLIKFIQQKNNCINHDSSC